MDGVGRKVADCVALFACDQTDCVPVDTHVFQMAVRWRPEILEGIEREKFEREEKARVRKLEKVEKERKKLEKIEAASPQKSVEDVNVEEETTATPQKSSDEEVKVKEEIISTPTKSSPAPTTPTKSPKKKITITDKIYKQVADVFCEAFPGGYAGWAHSVLFVAELPSYNGNNDSGEKKSSTKKRKRTPTKKEPKLDGGGGSSIFDELLLPKDVDECHALLRQMHARGVKLEGENADSLRTKREKK